MLIDELKKIFKGDILTDDATLETYSYDASVFKVRPQIVVFPKDTEDVKNLVKFVGQKKSAGENIAITPRAGGTDMSGGAIGESIVVVFTKYMNRIKEMGAEFCVVEPGLYFRDLEKILDEKNLLLPSYPASKNICAVGGMVSNNSGGEKTLFYGKTEKYVEELKMVLSDGEEYIIKPLLAEEIQDKISRDDFESQALRQLYQLATQNNEDIQNAKPNVSKNSAGFLLWNLWDGKIFHLEQIFIGAQGTLGLITEIKFRLVPKKKFSRLAAIFIKDTSRLPEIITAVLKFRPESLESFDDHTMRLAVRFFPTIARSLKVWQSIVLGWLFLPEAWMFLTGGMPKLVMLAEITGNDPQEIENRLRGIKDALQPFNLKINLAKSEAETQKYWIIRRESFNLLRKHVKDKRTVPFIDDVIVRPEKLGEFLPALNAILQPYQKDMVYTIAGHPGDGNFHIIPLMNMRDPRSREIIPEVADKVYDLVLKFGGSLTAEHNDGLIRGPYLKKMYGEKIYGLFEEVKKIFDPQNIFNPGKKIGATKEYYIAHLKTE